MTTAYDTKLTKNLWTYVTYAHGPWLMWWLFRYDFMMRVFHGRVSSTVVSIDRCVWIDGRGLKIKIRCQWKYSALISCALSVRPINTAKYTPRIHIKFHYTECNRRNGPDFGRVFLMLNYTEKPKKNLYPKFNGYGDIGQRKVWTSLVSAYCILFVTSYSSHSYVIARCSSEWPWRPTIC